MKMYLRCYTSTILMLTVLSLWSTTHAQPYACSIEPRLAACGHEYLAWFYDPTTGSCNNVGSAFCTGIGNGFTNEKECYSTCQATAIRCYSARESGNCMAASESYYYDPMTKSCKTFIYGGCGGNGNRFDTEYECKSVCGHI